MIRLDVTFLAESKLNINPPIGQLIIFYSNMIGAVGWSLTSSDSPLIKDASSFHTEMHSDQEILKCDNTHLVLVSAFVHVIAMTLAFRYKENTAFRKAGFILPQRKLNFAGPRPRISRALLSATLSHKILHFNRETERLLTLNVREPMH